MDESDGLRFEAGHQVGPYVVRGHLGAGAYGDVYLAERVDIVRQTLALKVIKPGMDSRAVIARFEAERQALALMSHPGIARFLDAGVTSEGRPYFAMEHVPGVPVTDHCDKQRLGIKQRIELFIMICEAVQHAHQKGIIHRDLKPGNILVAYEGQRAVPKVIDFGVAKALYQPLTRTMDLTEDGRSIGTTPYMSPEQAERTAQDIDTRSDVYSLGVLLYELLVGMRPFDFSGKSAVEVMRIIREVEAPTPSRRFTAFCDADPAAGQQVAHARDTNPKGLIGAVRSDLDWIVITCLQKDRERRYAGVDQLAEDLRRTLRYEPVRAARPSVIYRTRKFVRRHRGATLSATLLGGVVIAALVGGTALEIQKRVALAKQAELQERVQLRENADDARRLLDLARTDFLRTQDAERAGFDRDPVVDAATRRALRAPLRKKLERAIELDPDLLDARFLLVQDMVREGERAAATVVAGDALAQHPDSSEAQAVLAGLLDEGTQKQKLNDGLAAGGVRRDLLLYYRAITTADRCEAIQLLEQCLEENPWHFDATWNLAIDRQAEGDGEEVLRLARLLTKAAPEKANTWTLLGNALLDLGDKPAAIAALDQSIRRDPLMWRAHYDRAVALHRAKEHGLALDELGVAGALAPENGDVHALRGAVLYKLNDLGEAIDLGDAIDEYDEAIRLGSPHWWVYADRGEVQRKLGYAEAALADLDAALKQMAGLPSNDRARVMARVLLSRGAVLCDLRRLDESLRDLEEACRLQPDRAWCHAALARLHLVAGRYREAMRGYQKARDSDPALDVDLEMGLALWFSGDPAGAKRTFERMAERKHYQWVHLWIWDLEASRGNSAAASAALLAAEKADPGTEPAFTQVIRVLRGEAQVSDVDQLEVSNEQRLYADYILGAKARIDGRTQDAAELYRRALELREIRKLEHIIVEHQLSTL